MGFDFPNRYLTNSYLKTKAQLGMSYGKANHILKKRVMLMLLRRLKEDNCFRCGKKIDDETTLSLEHKEYWLDRDVSLFWDLDNISFSHLACNVGAARKMGGKNGAKKKIKPEDYVHGTHNTYASFNCRCDQCKIAHAKYQLMWRSKK